MIATDLHAFLSRLRQRGFDVGPAEHVDVDAALRALAARGADVTGPAAARWIRPLVCRTPEQCAAFDEEFVEWCRVATSGEAREMPAPPPAPSVHGRRWIAVAAVVVALAVVTVFAGTRREAPVRVARPPTTVGVSPGSTRTPTTVSPVVPQTPPPADVARLTVVSPRPTALRLAGIAACALAGAWFVRRRFARAHLRRARPAPGDITEALHAPAGRAGDFVPRGLARSVTRMRRPVPTATRVLDVPRSIRRTIERGGAPALAWKARTRMPEYVALRDRRGADDALWHLHDALVRRLVADGMPIRSFDFARDPRVVRPSDPRARAVRLDELMAQCPGDSIVVFGEADTVLRASADRFRDRPRHTIVVPALRDEWSAGAMALTEAGLRAAALTAPAAPYTGRPDRNAGAIPRPPVPRAVAGDPARWLSDEPPAAERVRECLDQLRAHLGDDVYAWLCACAVYPEIRWELTLVLGDAVRGALALPRRWTFEDLVRLFRLPWMRDARIPDWLRTEFVADLPPAVERRVRDVFDTVLTAERPDESSFRLEVAVGDRGLRRAAARERLAHDPAGVAARMRRDAVTLSWMRDRLTVGIPLRVARALMSQAGAHVQRPPRTLAAALTAALVVSSALSLLRYAPLDYHWLALLLIPYAVLCGCAATPVVRGSRGWGLAIECAPFAIPWVVAESRDSKYGGMLAALGVAAGVIFLLAGVPRVLVRRRRMRLGRAPLAERVADAFLLDRLVAWLFAGAAPRTEAPPAPRTRRTGWAALAAFWLPLLWLGGAVVWVTLEAGDQLFAWTGALVPGGGSSHHLAGIELLPFAIGGLVALGLGVLLGTFAQLVVRLDPGVEWTPARGLSRAMGFLLATITIAFLPWGAGPWIAAVMFVVVISASFVPTKPTAATAARGAGSDQAEAI